MAVRNALLDKTAADWKMITREVTAGCSLPKITWESNNEIADILIRYASISNIAFFPFQGFRNIQSVRIADEPSCIELASSQELPSIIRPASLTLFHFPDEEAQSALVLDLHTLPSSDFGYHSHADHDPCISSEHVFEIRPGRYVGTDTVEQLTSDETLFLSSGRIRTLSRWSGGHIVMISPASYLSYFQRRFPQYRVHLSGADAIKNLIEQLIIGYHAKRS